MPSEELDSTPLAEEVPSETADKAIENQDDAPDESPYQQTINILNYIRVLIILLALGGIGTSLAGCKSNEGVKKEEKTEETIESGKIYKQIKAQHFHHKKFGDVYVWHPRGRLKKAVVYLHGHSSWDVNKFWTNDDMKEKFKASKYDAQFVMPRSQRSNNDPFKQRDIKGVLKFANHETNVKTKQNVTLLAHSGGGLTVPDLCSDPYFKNVKNLGMFDSIYQIELGMWGCVHKWMNGKGHSSYFVASNLKNSVNRNKLFLKDHPYKTYTEVPKKPTAKQCGVKVNLFTPNLDHGAIKQLIPDILNMIRVCEKRKTKKSIKNPKK